MQLIAKVGISTLRPINNHLDDEHHFASFNSQWSWHPQTINKRLHVLCTWPSCQPDLYAKDIRCLEIDVTTRWNSTYEMFRQALMLQKSCMHFCQQNSEASAYMLSPAKWDHTQGIMKLLEPLSEATNVLCAK
ncbi:hypothetical protein VP01_6793g1, partial [Puccinia sorghi]